MYFRSITGPLRQLSLRYQDHNLRCCTRKMYSHSLTVFARQCRQNVIIPLRSCTTEQFVAPTVQLEDEYFDDPNNLREIQDNCKRRSKEVPFDTIAGNRQAQAELPNKTHRDVNVGDITKARLLGVVGEKRDFSFEPKGVLEIGEYLGMLRTANVGDSSGSRTYYFIDALASLESALLLYTTDTLCRQGFKIISIPDLVHRKIIEGCGFSTSGERTQVYRLEDNFGDTCLAGTGEMPIAGYFINRQFKKEELPLRFMAVSRCYRAETSSSEEGRGIYRVHQFNKVEMFGITHNDDGGESSQKLMDSFLEYQKNLFTEMGLHYRILDMPTEELGAPAYRKYDIEALLHAKNTWGEISSTSNCTDYQSRRLNMTYRDDKGRKKHCHTINGTACAVPRMIIAITEQNQNQNGEVTIPRVLRPYLRNQEKIVRSSEHVKSSWIKFNKSYKKISKTQN